MSDSATKLYVGNLAWEVTTDDLRQKFSEFGHVIDCIVMQDRDTGRSRGYGFVTFASKDDAENAREAMNDQSFSNRLLRVNIANPSGTTSYGGRGGYASSKPGGYVNSGNRFGRGGGGAFFPDQAPSSYNAATPYGNTGDMYSTPAVPYGNAAIPYANPGYNQSYGRSYAQGYDQQGVGAYQAAPAEVGAPSQYSGGQPGDTYAGNQGDLYGAAPQQTDSYSSVQSTDAYPAGQQGQPQYGAASAEGDAYDANRQQQQQQPQGGYSGGYGGQTSYGGARPGYNDSASH